MSKQGEAKRRQGYVPKRMPQVCANCEHYTSMLVEDEYGYETEKEMRCGIGEFAVKKMGSCRLWRWDATKGPSGDFVIQPTLKDGQSLDDWMASVEKE